MRIGSLGSFFVLFLQGSQRLKFSVNIPDHQSLLGSIFFSTSTANEGGHILTELHPLNVYNNPLGPTLQ